MKASSADISAGLDMRAGTPRPSGLIVSDESKTASRAARCRSAGNQQTWSNWEEARGQASAAAHGDGKRVRWDEWHGKPPSTDSWRKSESTYRTRTHQVIIMWNCGYDDERVDEQGTEHFGGNGVASLWIDSLRKTLRSFVISNPSAIHHPFIIDLVFYSEPPPRRFR